MIQFHPYYPSDFCFQGSVCNGPQFENMKQVRWLGTEKEKQMIIDQFDAMEAWAKKNGVTLYNGEFSAHSYGASLREDSLRWNRFIVGECERRNIAWNYYDFSEMGCFVYDTAKKEWVNELMDALFSVK